MSTKSKYYLSTLLCNRKYFTNILLQQINKFSIETQCGCPSRTYKDLLVFEFFFDIAVLEQSKCLFIKNI